ncbi:MAG: ATP-binding cassette domain-containing protein [Geminicoccaceae bacterium]
MARIELRDLAHAYGEAPTASEDWALKPLDFIFEDGAAYALLGPSGCGKTTLLNVISGLITPSRGQVLYDGADVTARATAERNASRRSSSFR